MVKNALIPEYLNEGLHFIPLGGSEQFGVNLNVYTCDGDLLAVDCGIGFANEYHPGIDLLLPDPGFIEDNQKNLKALIITHAHEDHVGAVAYLYSRFNCPIYTTPVTAVVLEAKLKEANVKNAQINVCQPLDWIKAGKFRVQFIPVSHSIPDTSSLLIETSYGQVLHSGDWNLDPAPVIGYATDSAPFKAAGDEGVLAYIGDSTNSEVPGRSGSESVIEGGLEREFRKCKGRAAVTIFSSNIGRVISIARAAQKCGREVGVVGRSLHNMIDAAVRCGYLGDIPEFLSEDDIYDYPPDKLVLLVTGSQGEPRSALAKIARGEFRDVELTVGDTVIFSARPIPGNESAINVVKNNLIAGGVRVVTPSDTDSQIHVSGHPCRDEISDMLSWVRPKLVIPVHGERMQLDAQAKFAQSKNIPAIVPNNGSVIKIAPGIQEVVDHIETGLLAVDQKRIISANHGSISERRKLQYSGVIHVSIAVNEQGKVMGKPKIDTVGLFDESEERFIKDLHNEIKELLDDMTWEERVNDHFLGEELRIGLRRFVDHLLGIKPKTTVHVIRV